MIEVNLLPDVKQEFIQAQKVRNAVVSMSILLSIAVGIIVTLLALYVYVAQPVLRANNEAAIQKLHGDLLKNNPDLASAVTVQNQVQGLADQHKQKNITSRIFDVLNTIEPQGENAVVYRTVRINTTDKTVTIEAEAANGYKALESFKKTIEGTSFEYKTDGQGDTQKVKLTDKISDGTRTLGEDSSGKKVLRFSISFVYNDALFARDSKDGRIVGPTQTNATDSATAVPKSLFVTGGNN